MTFPWETPPQPDIVALMQRDLAYIVSHTAILVHSNRPVLSMLINTPRGQLVPRGVCTFTDGSTIEFQDVGMPQPKAPEMTFEELAARVWDIARELGLELET